MRVFRLNTTRLGENDQTYIFVHDNKVPFETERWPALIEMLHHTQKGNIKKILRCLGNWGFVRIKAIEAGCELNG